MDEEVSTRKNWFPYDKFNSQIKLSCTNQAGDHSTLESTNELHQTYATYNTANITSEYSHQEENNDVKTALVRWNSW